MRQKPMSLSGSQLAALATDTTPLLVKWPLFYCMWKFTKDLEREHNFLSPLVSPCCFPAFLVQSQVGATGWLLCSLIHINNPDTKHKMWWHGQYLLLYNKNYRNRYVTCCWHIHDTHNWHCTGPLFPWFTPSESSAPSAAESKETFCLYDRKSTTKTHVKTCEKL